MAELRERLEKRRAERGGLANAIARALGLGMKMRQYELGKSFCDAVVAERGIEGLNEVWGGPDALPDLAQLESPASWLSPARLIGEPDSAKAVPPIKPCSRLLDATGCNPCEASVVEHVFA